ncbi:putative NADP-dependent alcohol dehydrogenase [Caenibius tardaugens NBRC 16725]|uniref:Putative NADP-dependent alcohol dehydrogenase n=1 Tax=Caenibius tardaugens NBRC 16725 TaxID=1219035 RepID=U2ZYP6_9SPHN|nr:NAD(P)-dependent alcohol dehydrogenase [Caenibius tardaugens]AZI37115.1 NAD(P)-dependent alcohol dehydrogenase [Caenibius tardaugens NBRC 16725]GAD47648.1 putative NADP-dependent alcohol dehydrogenase [Caenibius tardaugens NBRC 16725]
MKTIGYAAQTSSSPLAPFAFERRDLRPGDVAMEILYCGVCHSDLHYCHDDWGNAQYPAVPGHEIVGRVIAVGPGVTRHAVGDHVAVGCLIDSCMDCDQCHKGEEQMCRNGATGTYGGHDPVFGTPTRGGYSKHIVVREEFVLRVPQGLDVARAAPLLCAGITSYSPLRRWNVQAGSRVGVIGLGGLGHMAVKLAAAMGAHVTVISRTDAKRADALALGAHALLVSGDTQAMRNAASTLDLIIDTVPVEHDAQPYLPLLDIDGTLVVVGQVGAVGTLNSIPLLFGRRRITGSPIGGIAETQEMLDFCAERGVLPDVEMISMDAINTAFDRLAVADVRYRFVIDMASLAAA